MSVLAPKRDTTTVPERDRLSVLGGLAALSLDAMASVLWTAGTPLVAEVA